MIKRTNPGSSRCRNILLLLAIAVLLISVVVVGIVYAKNFRGHSLSSELKKTKPQTSQEEIVHENVTVKENGGWTVTYKDMGKCFDFNLYPAGTKSDKPLPSV